MQWRKDSLFNKQCWKNFIATCKRMTLEYYLTPYIKITSKWIKDLNLRPDTIKLLQENTLWQKSQQDPFGPLPRVVKRKTKINKQDLIKLKSFCTAKETINKVKRQHSEWVKIIANQKTDTKYITSSYNSTPEKPNQKVGKRPKQTFL